MKNYKYWFEGINKVPTTKEEACNGHFTGITAEDYCKLTDEQLTLFHNLPTTNSSIS